MPPDHVSQFDKQLADYKQMVILRQEECVAIADALDARALDLSRKATLSRVILIVLGAVVATKSAVELAMLPGAPEPVAKVVTVLFLLLGVVISVVAGMQAAFRYDTKVGELRSLSGVCRSYDKRFMANFKRDVDPGQPEVTLARLESLIELQNEAIDGVRRQIASLGVDISAVKTSYRVQD